VQLLRKEFTRTFRNGYPQITSYEAAEIVLTYKLSEELNEGQIQQISA
jgi:hypothetical protein